LKLTTDKHEASRGLSARAGLLVAYVLGTAIQSGASTETLVRDYYVVKSHDLVNSDVLMKFIKSCPAQNPLGAKFFYGGFNLPIYAPHAATITTL